MRSNELDLGPELTERFRFTPGSNGRLRWIFSGVWLIYLGGPLYDLLQRHGHSAQWAAGGFALILAFCTLYLGSITGRLRNDEPHRVWIRLAVLAALAALGSVMYGSDFVGLWIYVSAAVGVLVVGGRLTAGLIVVVIVAFSCFAWESHATLGEYLIMLLPTMITGFAMVGLRRQMVLVRELAQARETVARLAANEERLRLARDLHDLTGHSLSLITLKAELSQRLLATLPESPKRETLRKELDDIEHVSRQTLHDIREAVSGYRRPTLAVEIISARTALTAAGIEFTDDSAISLRSGTFDPDAEAALAWCLREATTNLIRHSGAHRCRITLRELGGELVLRVVDDGRGPVAADSGAAPERGNGLHGMSERLDAVGGRLSTGRAQRDGGFRLVAAVPDQPIPDPSTPGRPSAAEGPAPRGDDRRPPRPVTATR